MSKSLWVADPHVHAHRNSQQRLEDCLTALRWSFDVARSRGITDLVVLGDLFHDRQKIQVYTYVKTFEILRDYPEIHVRLLLGNHDLWYYDRLDVSSVHPFGSLGHVEVIDSCCTRDVAGVAVDFLPFTHNPVEAVRRFDPKSPVLAAHIAVDGAELNRRARTQAEVSVEIDNDMVKVDVGLFAGWRRVLLGHYHGAQKLSPQVEYVGSLLQLSYGEAFQRKHVAILDSDTLGVEYVENTVSPKHYILPASEVSGYDLNNSFVRVEVDDIGAAGMLDLKDELTTLNEVRSLEFVETKTVAEVVEGGAAEKFSLAEGDVLERYVAARGTGGLDHDELMALGRKIAAECNQTTK